MSFVSNTIQSNARGIDAYSSLELATEACYLLKNAGTTQSDARGIDTSSLELATEACSLLKNAEASLQGRSVSTIVPDQRAASSLKMSHGIASPGRPRGIAPIPEELFNKLKAFEYRKGVREEPKKLGTNRISTGTLKSNGIPPIPKRLFKALKAFEYRKTNESDSRASEKSLGESSAPSAKKKARTS